MVLLGVIFIGLRPLFGRWLADEGITAVISAFYANSASTLLFLPFGLRETWQTGRLGVMLTAAGSGVLAGGGTIAYFAALQRLPVTIVTIIYFTYPAMVVAASALLRWRMPRPPALLAVALVLFGCGLIIAPDLKTPGQALVDYAIAFLAPLSWALLLLMLSGPLNSVTPWSRIGFIAGGSLFALLLPLLVSQPVAYLPQTAVGLWGALGLMLISGVFAHVLLSFGVPKSGPERASITGVFEIATSLAVGWFVFLEPITLSQGLGVLLFGAAFLLSRRIEVELRQ